MKYLLLFAMGLWSMAWASPTIELRGMVAASNAGNSFALLSVNRRPAELVVLHGTVVGNLRLIEVGARFVVLSDGRVLRPSPDSHQLPDEAPIPTPRTEVTNRTPDQSKGRVEQVHVSRVE